VLDLKELSRVELVALVREQATLLEDQAGELLQLRAQVQRLKRLTSRNSGNSSMPPSTDDLPGRKKPAPKTKPDAGGAKRKPGQAARRREHEPAVVDDADVVEHRPGGECECGADLAEAPDEGVERACQVTDVPLVTARTTEHRMHRVRCGCGREHVAAAPVQAGTANTRVYGPNLRARYRSPSPPTSTRGYWRCP
jgi:hypothetical protein